MVASSPLLIRHAGQINVFSVAWTPFALWAARRFLASGRAWWAVAFGLAYLLNLLSSWYHAVALTLLVAMLSAIKLWQNRAERARAFERKGRWPIIAVIAAYVVAGEFNILVHFAFWLIAAAYFLVIMHLSQGDKAFRRLVARLTVGAAVAGLFVLPVVVPMYRAVQRELWLREVPLAAKTVFSADLASYLIPSKWVEGLFARQAEGEEDIYGPRVRGTSDVFPGFVAWLLLLSATAWRLKRGRRGLGWLALTGAFVVLSLGPILKFGGVIVWDVNPAKRVVLPAMLFHFIAVLEGIRVFLRFALTAYVCAAVFIAIQAADFVKGLPEGRKRRLATAGLGLATCLMVAERLDIPRPVARVPRVAAFEWLRAQPEGTVLLCPVIRSRYENLYSQTRHEKPMVNPYVSRRPEDMEEFVARNALLKYLERPRPLGSVETPGKGEMLRRAWFELGARWLVVDCYAYRPRALAAVHRLARDLLHLGVVFADERYVIFEQVRPGSEATGSNEP